MIGVLAAVTIVSYNGIQQRAISSASQSAASQAGKKLLAYAVDNNDNYPATLATAGVNDTAGTSFQYSFNNSSSPKTFCVTATTNTSSYWVSNASTSPTVGACAGHGVGGVAPVTNQFKNPFFIGPDGPNNYANMTNPLIVDVGGVKYAQMEATSTNPSSMRLTTFADRWTISPGQQVYLRVTVRNPNAAVKGFSVSLRFYDAAGSTSGSLISSPATAIVGIASGSTYTFTLNATAPASTMSVAISPVRNSTPGTPLVGDLIQATAVWLSDTDATPASGDSPGWAWNGTANASTSTGPPL